MPAAAFHTASGRRILKRSAVDSYVRAALGIGPDALFPREMLEERQAALLRDEIRYAKEKSRFYSSHLGGISPEEIRSVRDIEKLPFTDAAMLEGRSGDWLCLSAPEVQRIVTIPTSGTQSAPKRIFFTEREIRETFGYFAHGMTELAEPGDRALILFPCERKDSVGDLLSGALETIGVKAYRLGPPEDLLEVSDLIRREKITVMAGLPGQILGIAEILGERGYIKTALLSGDTAPSSMVRRIEALLGCETFGHFGMTELAYGGAVECRAHNGFHMRENAVLVELIDPDTGEVIRDGRRGEFVFTTLNREGMPFLRYRSGDLGFLFRGTCACGSPLVRMLPSGGRKGGREFMAGRRRLTQWELDEILFSLPGVVDYVLSEEEQTLTLYGVKPLNESLLRDQLFSPGSLGADASGRLKILFALKAGFSGRGMVKRKADTEE